MKMSKAPSVDLSLCIKCGVCTECCPAVFLFNSVGYIEVAELSDYTGLGVSEAVKNCPADCISWEET